MKEFIFLLCQLEKFLSRKCCMHCILLNIVSDLSILLIAELCYVRNMDVCLEHLQLILF